MLPHYFKILLRTSLKNKSYAFINVIGLAIGMTAFALIGLYVLHERSYDDFHSKKNQIFRVRQDRYTHGQLTRQWTAGPWGIGPDLKANFPEVVRYVSVNRGGARSTVLANGDILFKEDRVFYASEEFFRLFSYPLIKGIDSLVLRRPFTMVVSESLARRYFGEENPIGKTLKNNGKEEYEITGVFKDVPENSHLKFDALFSFVSLLKLVGPTEAQDLMSSWAWAGNYTYIELASSASRESFESKLPAFVEKQAGELLKSWGESMAFVLQPVPSIHLNSNYKDELEPNGDGRSTNYLALIAIFILVMAWINYINIATARSMERAKEVGVRKVLGSDRLQLIKQFLLESFVIKLIAIGISAILFFLLLPYFSTLIDRKIDLSIFNSSRTWLMIVGVFLVGVVISGLYPAFVISGFKPVRILKSSFQNSIEGNHLRKGMVAVQFISSIVLIAGTMAVQQQIQFMSNSQLGIDTEQMLVVQGPYVKDSTYTSRFTTFRQSLLQYPEITKVTASTDVPGRTVRASNGGIRLVGQDVKLGNSYRVIMADEDFEEAYGMKLISGRYFSRDFSDHWKTALVNETAMKLLGFTAPEKIIGQKIYVWDETLQIVGVIKDYHHESLKKKVDQLIFVCDNEIADYYTLKVKTSKSLHNLINRAEAAYKTSFPGNPFHYFLLDEYFNQQYKSDQQFGKVFGLFAVIGIFIACLGLFGLSSYSVLQRMKEIGIRKVLGASVNQITMLVSKEFIQIVLLANVIAWPISYLLIDNWLSSFASRINLGILSFVIPGAIALFIGILTVSSQSIKAALANPVNSLKNE
jgi:putative ABC transport system permease protein